jgi:hypothetical protein
MTSWCKDILSSIKEDSSWIASIYMPSSIWSEFNLMKENSYNEKSIVSPDLGLCGTGKKDFDIVLLFSDSELIKKKVVECSLTYNYPKNALFHFESYDSYLHKDELIQHIKKKATEQGNYLVIKSTKKQSGIDNNYEVVLACQHYGLPKKSTSKKLHFDDNSLQATNTIIEPKHHAPSRKNYSRSSYLKRVTSSSNHDDSKANKCQTLKCGCLFSITIFFHHASKRWFLKKKTNNIDANLHTNHIWINPIHQYVSKNDLSQIVKDTIYELIQCGTNDANIKIYIYSQYSIHVKIGTIYNMRMTHIQGIIDLCSEDPGGSSVDKLIALFKNTPDVSCVYLLHKYNSGLVRYRKNKKRIDHDIINNSNILNGHGYCNDTITNWRDTIKLSKTNDVLVAFAWAHDDEIRNTEMFPEMIGMDVTFGVCKERRDLLVAGGIDGNNQAFTAFRCFIPSKLEQTYTWIINEAMNYLLTAKSLKFNSCISTDQEFCLNASIMSSISSQHTSFRHSRLRLDCYHFYRKVWNKNVDPFVGDHVQSKLILMKIDKWIMSWFKEIETQYEFDISLIYLKKFMETTTKVIGQYCSDTISNLLTKLVNKQKLLFHHHFLTTTNFDFLGDSFIEALNQSIKKGPISVNAKMDISNSGFTQLKATSATSIKRKLERAKNINTKKLWSISNTSSYLTKYAEGLMCDIYDRRALYTNVQISSHKWLVVHKNSLDESRNNLWNTNHNHCEIKFTRLRQVSVDLEGFMTCSCEFPSRWLLPCSHICNVLNSNEYLVPELVHIRWWKHFNYLYKNNCAQKRGASQKKIKDTLEYIRSNHFCKQSGKYKGVPLHDNSFLKDVVHKPLNIEISQRNKYFKEIMALHEMKKKDGWSLIRGSRMHEKYMCTNVSQESECSFENISSDYNHIVNTLDDSKTTIQNIGVGSSVQTSLSQQRMDMELSYFSGNDDDVSLSSQHNTSNKHKNAYNSLYPLFCEIANNIKNEEDLQEAKSTLECLEFGLKAKSLEKKKRKETDTVFLGEKNGSRCIEKRHKTWNEK